jgi:myb proto-oncogene protein
LQDAIEKLGSKNRAAIAALVPGRTTIQCKDRWRSALYPRIEQTNGRSAWMRDEDIKLKEAVRMYGGKNWAAIAAQVPGRTKKQCHTRWNEAFQPSIDQMTRRTGKWEEDEDIKLKDAVRKHGAGNNWGAISGLVPGRRKVQSKNRWHSFLAPSMDQSNGRKDRWTEDEDTKLKGVVEGHGGKYPDRGTVLRKEECGTLNKAPGLGQDLHY